MIRSFTAPARSLLLAALVAAGAAACSAPAGDDPLLWLEDPHGAEALEWARAATERTRRALGAGPNQAAIGRELETLLQAAPTEPDVHVLGMRALRLQRDAAHPYGLLQVATLDDAGRPGDWRTVLDVAELREREGIPFELQAYELDSACRAPDYGRCLLRLSPAGGDEVELREFDLARGSFVEDGFRVPKSRAFAHWLDADTVLVMHTLDGAPTTLPGWPATARVWKRGEPLSSATVVFEGQPSDALLNATVVGTGDGARAVITRAIDYSTFETWLVGADGERQALPFPQAIKGFGLSTVMDRYVVVQLAADADVEGKAYPAETLLAYDTAKTEGDRVSVVYQPGAGEFVDTAFGGVVGTGRGLALVADRHLAQRVVEVEAGEDGWRARDVFEATPGDTISLRAAGGRDGFVMALSGFLTPRSQVLVDDSGAQVPLARDPEIIDASGFTTELGSATSKDGTSIDYFLLRPKQVVEGAQPLLMTGYGAFGISFRPGYFDPSVGGPALKLWLDRGGALAIPAIRGGGERGAQWHESVIREKRQTSYDDFIAVVEHLVATGFTRPERIGIFGMSNGGLLTATLGTQRPDLFNAVVSDVPLTDLIRMRHMGMGAAWMNEYGNPDVPEQAAAMLAYSPYQNVRSGTRYPPFLVTISTEDNRVGPGHARKFAHRLEEVGAPVFFYEDEEGGHGVSDALRNPELMALRMGFLIDRLMPAAN
ncbi:prolyl oligopeptidase family serine peptidase [Luteimonas wenzhouensis]|uniref:prolyl oligopeptidase n=1 Tax=Luteimonas wenzhouensis TaxID=2599615 RepID=A0A5C5U3V0_9GAMM|nr:prolyl oligopeptidase family serine peptidase [Luteimonas wenzhouensis]TWT20594.1 S9 family peptidase [Luteimonas wenzhouensis]